jgi:hypothetical protein
MADPVPKDAKQCDVTEILDKTDSSMILDSTDVSTENEDHQTVFDAKENCIDTVLEFNLQTDQGKVFGLQCEQDFNAQHIDASLEDYSVKSTKTSLDASNGNVIEAVADAYDIAIGLDTSLVNVTKQHPGGPTIEVPVEDIPPDPDVKEKLMDAVLEGTCQIDHGKALVTEYVSDFGKEMISDSLEEDLVALINTSIFVSPISSADDTWQTIARCSMLHWDNIARDATFHWREKCGLFKRDEIVLEHVTDSLQQVMLPNAVHFIDELQNFEIPLSLSNTAISSSLPLVMPPSTKLHADLTVDSDSSSLCEVLGLSSSICEVTRIKKSSSSVDEVAPQLDILRGLSLL